MDDLLSVDDLSRDLVGVLSRFRGGSTRAFSFGAGVPEAVVLTYDEFVDLGGESMVGVGSSVVEPARVGVELPVLLTAIRAGAVTSPVVWGEGGVPEAVVLSTVQYRRLRGDDEPPAGVVDDPTRRTYSTEPLPDSKPFTLDEIAELMGPEAVRDLEELRRKSGPERE